MNTFYQLTKTVSLLSRPVLPAALIILCLLILPTLSKTAGAEQKRDSDPSYVFYKGNAFYEDAKYSEAIEEYTKLSAMGMESGNLYYNLGNSYFKKGEFGKAILYYERAKRLIPRDSDLKSNYDFAVSHIQFNLSAEKNSWFRKVFSKFNFLTIDEMTIILSSFFVLAIIFLIIRMCFPAAGKLPVIFVSVSVIVIILLTISLSARTSLLNKENIILTKSADANFEPFDSATTHFTLYEGMKVQVLYSKDKWNKIKRPDGKIGWIRARDMEKI